MLSVNTSVTLEATIYPSSDRDSALVWFSSNSNVATVENGVVTARETGEADISVMALKTGHTAVCHVTVYAVPSGLRLNRQSVTLNPGESVTLKASPVPEGAAPMEVRWLSTAPGVATVSDGVVTALAPGKCTITAITSDGKFSASCDLAVKQAEPEAGTYTITLHPNGGKVDTESKTLTDNDTIYGELPEPVRAGYTFLGWYTATVDGTKITSDTPFSEKKSQTLYALWEVTVTRYNVKLDANGGTVTPSSFQVASAGTYSDLPVPVRPGCGFQGWFTEPDGGVQINSWTKVRLTADQTLYAHWIATNRPDFTANGQAVASAEELSARTDLSGSLVVPDAAAPEAFSTATAFCALYDAHGIMVHLEMWAVDVSDPRNIRFMGNVHIPEGVTVRKVKVIVLSENLVPLQAAGML